MAGRPLRAPRGFLTIRQVSQRARKELDVHINPKTLRMRAHTGDIPHAQRIPSRRKGKVLQKGIMFPESKFLDVVRAAPKKSVLRKDEYSTHNLLRLAKERNLKIYLTHIQTKLARIEAGIDPWPEGLKRDPFDSKHRWILPEAFVKEMLAKAAQGKHLPAKPWRKISLLSATESFMKRVFKDVEWLRRLPVGDVRREAYEKQIAGEINNREQKINEAKRKLAGKRKPTIRGQIEQNNLDIALAKLEMLSWFLEGGKLTDREADMSMQQINELESKNKTLGVKLKRYTGKRRL